jgi:eukaryotic-like serine/threonine-protein kinase
MIPPGSAMPLAPGTRLGPYEIVAQLGQGGMGIVFRARDTKLDREAKAVAALSHPNILAIYDFGQHEGTVYAAMELLEDSRARALDAGREGLQRPFASRKPSTVSQ